VGCNASEKIRKRKNGPRNEIGRGKFNGEEPCSIALKIWPGNKRKSASNLLIGSRRTGARSYRSFQLAQRRDGSEKGVSSHRTARDTSSERNYSGKKKKRHGNTEGQDPSERGVDLKEKNLNTGDVRSANARSLGQLNRATALSRGRPSPHTNPAVLVFSATQGVLTPN